MKSKDTLLYYLKFLVHICMYSTFVIRDKFCSFFGGHSQVGNAHGKFILDFYCNRK